MRKSFIFLLLLLTGCIPQWRVFQKEVPAPVYNTVTEGQKEAALWLSTAITDPVEAKPVAASLSASLGLPATPVLKLDLPDSRDLLIEHLTSQNTTYQKKLAEQQSFLAKNKGAQLEGTGINLFGGAVVLSVGALIAALIFIPGFLSFVLWAIHRLGVALKAARTALRQTAQGVEGFKVENPKVASEVDEWLQSQMDEASRSIIKATKKTMDWKDVHEAATNKSSASTV